MPARQADLEPRRDPLQTPLATAAAARRRWRPIWVAAAVAVLLVGHWTLGTSALREKCTTVDEIIHLVGGCSYWQLNDYRLQPENGNLPQRWHALPLVLAGCAKLPPPAHPAWQKSDVWELGWAFFYESGNDANLLLARGRAMAALLGVATCLVVFLWSWRLFGVRGGLVSLTLAALCPTMLAHGPLATSDMCLTLFLLLSVWAIWELLHEITPLRLAGGMLAIAGLFLSKMSAPLILPIAGLLVLVRLVSTQTLTVRLGSATEGRGYVLSTRAQQAAAALGVTLVCGLFAWTMVWAAYGFRYSAFAEGPLTDAQFYKLHDLPTACSVLQGRSGRIIAGLADRQLLPEAYLYGTAFVLAHLRRVAFLNGEYSIDGWRHYFPYCFAVKTPLALLGVLALAVLGLRRSAASLPETRTLNPEPPPPRPLFATVYNVAPLIVLLTVLWASAITSTFNIGIRHILPVYPTLYILAGAAGLLIQPGRRLASCAVIVCVALFAADSLAAYPHYLAYFNQLLPRDRAYQHLVDSNLDWGQDLPGLKRWLDEHNTGHNQQPVFLAYWGKGLPAHEDIAAHALTSGNRYQPGVSLAPGLYCISASGLQAVFEDAPGHWNKTYEQRYQARRQQLAPPAPRGRVAGGEGAPATPGEISAARAAYQYGQYLRLLAYLRHRPPDAHVGYSILIFRLTAEELDQALKGPPAELDEQPWMPKRAAFL